MYIDSDDFFTALERRRMGHIPPPPPPEPPEPTHSWRDVNMNHLPTSFNPELKKEWERDYHRPPDPIPLYIHDDYCQCDECGRRGSRMLGLVLIWCFVCFCVFAWIMYITYINPRVHDNRGKMNVTGNGNVYIEAEREK